MTQFTCVFIFVVMYLFVHNYAIQELKCPLDEFELLLFTSNNGKKVHTDTK